MDVITQPATRNTQHATRSRTFGILIGAVVAVLALGALGVWAFQSTQAGPGGPIPPLTPLAAVVYQTDDGAIHSWDAGDGTDHTLLQAAPASRRLLSASADGTMLAYLESVPVVTDTVVPVGGAYDLRVWTADSPPRTVPLPDEVSENIAAEFFDGGLAVLLRARSSQRGPLYVYDPDARLLRPIAPQVDSYALAPGLVAYARPINPAEAAQGTIWRQINVLDLTTGDPATGIISFTVAQSYPRPVQLYYEPAHNAFVYSAARPVAGSLRGNTQMWLGMFLAGTTAPSRPLALQVTRPNTVLDLTDDGRQMLYGAPNTVLGTGNALPRPQLASLAWLTDSLKITADQPVSLPQNLDLRTAAFMRGRDWLVATAAHTAARTGSGPVTQVDTTPVLALYDPATRYLDMVLDGTDGMLLAVLDERRLLLGVAVGTPGSPPGAALGLALAARGSGGWQTRALAASFLAQTSLAFVGVLPDGAALVYARPPGAGATLYRVPLDGSASKPVAQVAPDSPYFPVYQP
jgi:hypothetical protein